MFILLLSITDVHKITIFLGKFGSTKTTVIHSYYVADGRTGCGDVWAIKISVRPILRIGEYSLVALQYQ